MFIDLQLEPIPGRSQVLAAVPRPSWWLLCASVLTRRRSLMIVLTLPCLFGKLGCLNDRHGNCSLVALVMLPSMLGPRLGALSPGR